MVSFCRFKVIFRCSKLRTRELDLVGFTRQGLVYYGVVGDGWND
jgi:hypothetical protein